jgi:hypothetical protein
MAITLTQGLTINSKQETDDRTLYATVDGCLNTGEIVNGVQKPRLAPSRRYVDMPVYIQSEQRYYQFVGGIANENFEPVASGGGGITKEELEAAINDRIGDLSELAAKLKSEGYLP